MKMKSGVAMAFKFSANEAISFLGSGKTYGLAIAPSLAKLPTKNHDYN
jgi:hypothetical protein